MPHPIHIKRIYQPPAADDGFRVLVDRIWPRGLRREGAPFDVWLKHVGPSTDLRKWFGHDPAKWDEFKTRYFAELDADPATLQPIRDAMQNGPVTLLYSARDQQHNQAAALREYLLRHR